MPTTGLDLRVKRVRARVSLKALVAALPRSRTWAWELEKAAVVDPSDVKLYLAALETCRNVKEGEAA
jgi:hypothetical protein